MKNLLFLIFTAILQVNCTEAVVPELSVDAKDSLKMGKSLNLQTQDDITGKLIVGYQGWYTTPDDNAPLNRWNHWSVGNDSLTTSNPHFDMWPDISEYTVTYSTPFPNFKTSDRPARLFSSYDESTVRTHLKWMAQYGIDVVALQRFGASLTNTNHLNWRNDMAEKISEASRDYERKFYFMYDISGWNRDTFVNEIKDDWNNHTSDYKDLDWYAKQNNKPVVCIWGVGSNNFTQGPVTQTHKDRWQAVIDFFKSEGCYVIVGVPKSWKSSSYSDVVETANMVSPWTVNGGATYQTVANYEQQILNETAGLDSLGVDFLPVLFAGFSWSNWNGGPFNARSRDNGDFLWAQFEILKNAGINNSYIAMFDEYDEATAIAKGPESMYDSPDGHSFLTHDIDGEKLSNDFYLRLVRDGNEYITGASTMNSTPYWNYFSDCDEVGDWGPANRVFQCNQEKQGLRCIRKDADSLTVDFELERQEVLNVNASEATAYLTFWYFVSDPSKLSNANQVEIGSGGEQDLDEYNWSLDVSQINPGWNRIELKFSEANKVGSPEINGLNWFRLYNYKTGVVASRLDGIQVIP